MFHSLSAIAMLAGSTYAFPAPGPGPSLFARQDLSTSSIPLGTGLSILASSSSTIYSNTSTSSTTSTTSSSTSSISTKSSLAVSSLVDAGLSNSTVTSSNSSSTGRGSATKSAPASVSFVNSTTTSAGEKAASTGSSSTLGSSNSTLAGTNSTTSGSLAGNASIDAVALGLAEDSNSVNAAWRRISCNKGSLTSVLNDPLDQWNDAQASDAWSDMLGARQKNAAGSLPTFLGDFFHARPNLACDVLDNPNCEITVNCGQNDTPNAPVNSPAGYVVINSLVGLHTLFEDVYAAINDALPFALGNMGNLVNTFSPVVEDIADQQKQKLILDLIQGALFVALGPSFHAGLKRLPWAVNNPIAVSSGIDATYGALGAGFAAVKDAMASLSTLPIQNEFTAFVSETTKTWLESISAANNAIFNDPAKLLIFIDQGQTFAADPILDPVDATSAVEKALYAASIGGIWRSGGDNVLPPVILTSEGLPQDGTGCESWRPEDYPVDDDLIWRVLFHDDVASIGRVCDGDTAYWLAGVFALEGSLPGESGDLDDIAVVHGITNFHTLRGQSELDGSKWAGLTKDDIVLNAVNTYKANGNKNAEAPLTTYNSEGDIEALVSADLKRNRGVVNIPVCSMAQLLDTSMDVDNFAGNPNWPCP